MSDVDLVLFKGGEEGDIWVDIKCPAEKGGLCNVGISVARTEKTAYKRAMNVLRKLADEAEKRYESLNQ